MRTFDAAIQPYLPHWDEWINSNQCFLRIPEKEIANLYKVYRDIPLIAQETGRTEKATREYLRSSNSSLKWEIDDFYKWLKEKPQYEVGSQAYYMEADLAFHNISERLFLRLKSIGDSLSEITEFFSLEELGFFEGFGKKCQEELVKLLTGYNCLHYLRKKKPLKKNTNTVPREIELFLEWRKNNRSYPYKNLAQRD